MHLPLDPPDFNKAIQQAAHSPDRLNLLLSGSFPDDRYLHWDQLRHRPSPTGLSHEDWWAALKLRRRQLARTVPLQAADGTAFTVALTDRIIRASETIARRAGGPTLAPPGTVSRDDRSRYIYRSLTEEAIRSSQLEGATTSRRVAIELLDSQRQPRSRSERMILNNYHAMMTVKDWADRDVSTDDILALHRIIVDGTLDDPVEAGRLDSADKPRVKVWDDDQLIHTPPPADQLPSRLASLCEFANATTEAEPYLPPVVRAIIVHFMFGYDHYFADGNGRLARVMFYWSLLRSGYWLAEYVSISKILRKAHTQYANAYLYTESDDNDLTYFVHYQLDVLGRALDELDSYLNEKAAHDAELRQALSGSNLNDRQTRALDALARRDPAALTAAEYAQRFRVTGQTARNDLNSLTDQKLLVRRRAGHAFRWEAAPNVVRTLTELSK